MTIHHCCNGGTSHQIHTKCYFVTFELFCSACCYYPVLIFQGSRIQKANNFKKSGFQQYTTLPFFPLLFELDNSSMFRSQAKFDMLALRRIPDHLFSPRNLEKVMVPTKVFFQDSTKLAFNYVQRPVMIRHKRS